MNKEKNIDFKDIEKELKKIKDIEKSIQTIKKTLSYRYKDLSDIRGTVRDEVRKLISEKSEEYSELRAVFTPKRLKAEIRKIIDFEIESHLEKSKLDNLQREQLLVLMKEYFSKYLLARDILEEVRKGLKEEIRVIVRDTTIHEYVKDLVNEYIKKNIHFVVEKTLAEWVKDINNRLSKEYKITKDLCYSIETEIKHTLMKLPISVVSEQLIKDKLDGMTKKCLSIYLEKEKLQLEDSSKSN